MIRFRTGTAMCAAMFALFTGQSSAEPVFGITDPRALGGTTALVTFDSTTPNTVTIVAPLSGVNASTIRAIDFRPSNGLLYAVGVGAGLTSAQLYTINTTTGALTAVGGGFALAGNTSTSVSIDFNPVVDALRVVTGNGTGNSQSYRVNANTGALIAQDVSITSGVDVADIAYSNNVAGASTTTLYAYDFASDNIDTIGSVGGTPTSPNSGTAFVVGFSGLLSGSEQIGLDISGVTGFAYASVFDFSNAAIDGFYRINLANGAATLIGQEAFTLMDFSVRTAASVAAVPEPDTLAMLGLGLAGLLVARRRSSVRA